MKFDTTLLATDLSQIPQLTRQAEAIGFDGIWVSETAHDAFLPLVLAAEHSQRVTLGTSIALAFLRSPAILAYLAWDLAKYSQGRMVVGLGPQTNNHFQ
jgi:alkanesulfonate monooxygenase SsuD/methylene tetrahydromethanopterin reductase-like flavin-dependent oxidoreductase (luciferase family)